MGKLEFLEEEMFNDEIIAEEKANYKTYLKHGNDILSLNRQTMSKILSIITELIEDDSDNRDAIYFFTDMLNKEYELNQDLKDNNHV